MQNSKKLLELISSLSKSEKIYLKKFSLLHGRGKTNNYIRLFDLLQKKKSHRRTVTDLSQTTNSIAVNMNLPSTKNYLYKLIFKSLRNYCQSKNPTLEIKNLLIDIHILLHRGLYSQCQFLISRTKKVALKNNLHLDYLSILRAEFDLLIFTKASLSFRLENMNEQHRVLRILKKSIKTMDNSTHSYHSFTRESIENEQTVSPKLFQLTATKYRKYRIGSN